tara:strand:+ start:3948 stop:4484 length:537 start_codon:yes stop_codon:yes gene_type:complete
MIKLKDILFETLPKNKWVSLKGKDLKDFRDEIFDLVKKSYASIGGHPNIKSPSDISLSSIDYWDAIDVDDDPYPDAISGAKARKGGKKYTLGATDGSSPAKRAYVGSRIKKLKQKGHYAELSHKIADIMASAEVPIVDDEEEVKRVLKGKSITWLGDGWYERNVGGKKFKKRMFGRPK